MRLAVAGASISVAAGDFNGDGAADLAVGTEIAGQGAVSLLISDGRGAFTTTATDVGSEGSVFRIAVFDADRDGAADVLVNTPAVVYGDGRGGLAGRTLLLEGYRFTEAWNLLVNDVNQDDVEDVVTNTNGTITLHLGIGRRSFPAPGRFPAGEQPLEVAAADLDSDELLDLTIANGTANPCQVLLGDGRGSFAGPAAGFLPAASGAGLAVADFNADGSPDIALGGNPHGLEAEGAVQVVLGDGTGRFELGAASSGGRGISHLTLTDLDADSRADLAVTNRLSGTMTFLRGDGSGAFSRAADVAIGEWPTRPAAADLNGDGHMDLAIPAREDGDLTILLGDGAGAPHPVSRIALEQRPHAALAGDFDADGRIDLGASGFFPYVDLFPGDGSGGFGAPTRLETGRFCNCLELVWEDFNADGARDLVAACESAVALFFGDGRGGFSHPVALFARGAQSAEAGDFNRDGLLDLAVPSSSGRTVSIYLNQLVRARLEIQPSTLATSAPGLYLTAHLGFEANSGAKPEDVHLDTVRLSSLGGRLLNESALPVIGPAARAGDGWIVKFDRPALQALLREHPAAPGAQIDVAVTGELRDLRSFRASTALRLVR